MFKKTILIDFDGVLNLYDGKFDEKILPPIKEGAFEFIKNLSENFKIKIFTTRNTLAVLNWLAENKLERYIDDVTNKKEPYYLIIDAGCICFNGNYSDLEEQIQNFRVWYKS